MIRIRPFKEADTAVILSWCTDEDTYYKWTAGIWGEYPVTEEQFSRTGDLIRFTALDEKEPVGFFTFRNPKGTLDELRFGFVIVNPDKRRCGFGKAMLQLGTEFAFRIYHAEKVSLGVFEDNIPAIACYQSAGFERTPRREIYRINGKERTAFEMEILRREPG